MINILIPEETPSRNKGEAAILSGMVETFKLLNQDIRLSLFSFDLETDSSRYFSMARMIDANGIMPSGIMFRDKSVFTKAGEYILFVLKLFSFMLLYIVLGRNATKVMRRDVWQEYCNADLVILAHDSAFAPLYHCFLIHFLKLLRKKVVIYSATIQPNSKKATAIKKTIYNLLIKSALNRLDLITLREKKSFKYLKKYLKVDTPIHLTGDLAFLVPPCTKNRTYKIMEKEGILKSNPIIGITLSRNKVKVCFPNIKNYPEKEEKFVSVMAEVVEAISLKYFATIVFIPHCIIEDNERDDRVLAQKVFEKINNDKIKVINNEYSEKELKGLVGEFDFCLGTRLHFIVDATSMCVPSVIMTNQSDYRVHGIIGEMLNQKQWIYNIESLSRDSLINKIDEAWSLREKTRSELQVAIEYTKKQTWKNGELLLEIFLKDA